MEKSIRSVIGIIMATVMAVIIGAAAIVGIKTVNDGYADSYDYHYLPSSYMANILSSMRQLGSLPYRAVVACDAGPDEIKDVLYSGDFFMKDFETYASEFDYTIINPEVRSLFDNTKDVYFNTYKPLWLEMQNKLSAGADRDDLRELIVPMQHAMNQMIDNCNACLEIVTYSAKISIDESEATANLMTMIIIILIVIEIILSVVFIIVSIAADRSPKPVSVATPVANGKFPVYAMYPADPSNPVSPPNATHVLYPIIHPFTPNEPRN